MSAGRPLKFETEKEFVEYLVQNVDFWVKDFFGEQVESVKENAYLKFKRFGANQPRIDIVLRTKNGKKIGIECKNPSQSFHELSRSVSQLLAYALIAEEQGEPFDELALFSSSKDDIAFRIIDKFKLPIRIFYIDREIHGEMKYAN